MPKMESELDNRLRQQIYQHIIRRGGAPTLSEMAKTVASSPRSTKAALDRLCQSHAFLMQENGELWRAAPFSAVPTAFPVRIGRRSWYGNCIWDALGIPAMLKKDGEIDASCGCCNQAMPLRIRKGRLLDQEGIIHFAVPARQWYQDVVFT